MLNIRVRGIFKEEAHLLNTIGGMQSNGSEAEGCSLLSNVHMVGGAKKYPERNGSLDGHSGDMFQRHY